MKRLLRPILFALLIFGDMGAEEDLGFTKVDVTKLATHSYGTELLLLENSHYTEQKGYKFEDFFWTGSGDGPPDENMWTSDGPSIIYKTSTVISTIFVESTSTHGNISTTEKPKCTFNCESPKSPGGDIDPTPTFTESSDNAVGHENGEDFFDADKQFWLLTILKSDGKDPIIIELKNSLAKLYKTAFQRQQAEHLGIITRQKRTPPDKPVNVYIHKIDRHNGDDKIEVLYHVEVQGKPVDAYTAANDMNLVTDEEVRRELGYPFLIKAEPYLKAAEPLGLSNAKNTWFVIGISIIGVLLILLVLAFLTLGLTKRKRFQQANAGIENRRHIFERGIGHENKGLVQDEDTLSESKRMREESPTYINFGNQHTRASVVLRPQSSASGSSSSSSSLDISPLMNINKKHKTPPKKPPRPRAALNKTVPLNTTIRKLPSEVFDSDSSTSRKDDSPDIAFGENLDPGVMSPKSYLSMPSVKSFPSIFRTNMPEPLNKVLEPVSVTHLDMPEDESCLPQQPYRRYGSETLVRHGSVGTVEDPGVIGPVVWNMHCERLKHGVSVDQGINDIKNDLNPSSNISRMRKRFHDLLDDTFSLFGNSRKGSPVDDNSRPIAIEVKSHSANDNRPNDLQTSTLRPRPRTTGAKKTDLHSSGPSCAWSSTAPSPLIRAVSAAPRISSAVPSVISIASSRAPTAPGGSNELYRAPSGILRTPSAPRVNVEHILAEGKFRPSDPAISVIEAIKTEIERVSLPGSTRDLNK